MTINLVENQYIAKKEFISFFKDIAQFNRFKEFLNKNWTLRSIFYNDNIDSANQSYFDFSFEEKIKVNSYIGMIVFENVKVTIFPKLLKQDASIIDTSLLVNNLFYWLSYCENLNFPFFSSKIGNKQNFDLYDYLVTIYINILNKLVNKQPFFMYEEIYDISSSVKGKIDFKNYFLTSFSKGLNHKIPHQYSSFEFDNLFNQAIKFILLKLSKLSKKQMIINNIRSLLYRFSNVSNRTIIENDFEKITINRINKEYLLIKDLTKMFFINRTIDLKDELYSGFLFLLPSEKIFEGFISGVIKAHFSNRYKIYLQGNKNFTGRWFLNNKLIREGMRVKEDIIIEDNSQKYILDVKYKYIDSLSNININEIDLSHNDINQIINYSLINNANIGFLIYPDSINGNSNGDEAQLFLKHINSNINIYIIKLPFLFRELTIEEKGIKIGTKLKSLEKIMFNSSN